MLFEEHEQRYNNKYKIKQAKGKISKEKPVEKNKGKMLKEPGS